ncbi:L,D-transpeptidase Cds6 family protein [Comamonas composti]|uniref:L,D-transpeptidase Cds6 family protein n=1 Tax=Comamonas composti TaxID=408558 RepID=UPI001FDF29E8|nr:tetratricopeptide repeat protein [Comamonas composti]
MAAASLGVWHGAHAAQDAVAEVAQLLEQGKTAQAAREAESYLRKTPGDVQMRFMQGVIAAEQKRSSQAIAIFTGLTKDYPNLPEPYNNLAVLYAETGQEAKAVEVLGQAIRTNPSYATAHENLGDLYARMASEAYSKALQIDGGRQAGPQPKLALITRIHPKAGDGGKTVLAAAPKQATAQVVAQAQQPAAQKEPPKPVAAATLEPRAAARKDPVAPAPQPVPAPPPPAVPAPAVIPPNPLPPKPLPPKVAVAAAPAPAVSAPAPAPEPAKPQPAAKDAGKEAARDQARQLAKAEVAEVEQAVQAWAQAWARQDMTRYLDAYSDKFKPGDGSSLPRWKEQRRMRIVGKAAITVTLSQLRTTVNGSQATAQFRQQYKSGALNVSTRKTLRMQKEGNRWRITQESTG